jgi:hypothetical protein
MGIKGPENREPEVLQRLASGPVRVMTDFTAETFAVEFSDGSILKGELAAKPLPNAVGTSATDFEVKMLSGQSKEGVAISGNARLKIERVGAGKPLASLHISDVDHARLSLTLLGASGEAFSHEYEWFRK